MKTIFVPIFSGIEGKNILRGGIYEELKKRTDIRIIFFVGTFARAAYYQKEYPELTFEVIKRYQKTPLDRLFSFFKFFTLRTHTIDLKRYTQYTRSGSWVRFVLSFVLNRLLGNYPVRSLIRWFDANLVTDPVVKKFFDTYNPDAVFLADLFNDTEISMLREAKKRGIPSIGYLSSWDRLTSRWGIRLLPNHLIVYNEVLRDEAVEYADMPRAAIFVSGAVQLDVHIAKKPLPRQEFLRELQLSPETKYIVYGPLGRSFDATNRLDMDMVTLLNRFVAERAFGDGVYKVIVRFPPNDFVEQEKLTTLPHVMYDIPGVRFATVRGQDWDMKPSELDHLRNLLTHASVVVCYYSSLSVDSAVFDTPIININFFPDAPEARHPYYQTTHYQKVASIGGIALVENQDQLLHAIQNYLRNPALDREKRKLLVVQQAYRLDGMSAARIVDKVYSVLYNKFPLK